MFTRGTRFWHTAMSTQDYYPLQFSTESHNWNDGNESRIDWGFVHPGLTFHKNRCGCLYLPANHGKFLSAMLILRLKPSQNGGHFNSHYKWPFSIATLNYQRVYSIALRMLQGSRSLDWHFFRGTDVVQTMFWLVWHLRVGGEGLGGGRKWGGSWSYNY